MLKSKVGENIALGFSKKRKKTDLKEMKKENESNEEEKEKKMRKESKKGKGKKLELRESDELPEPSEEKIETLVIVPPDGGWGWVIVLCSFVILCCSDGSLNSYGVFSEYIEGEFEVSVGETSSIASCAACLYYVCGPVWGALGNRFGFRSILISGAALMAAANFATFFIHHYFLPFAIVYAVGVGTGGGMVCMSVYVMVGVYFERWRGYATSIISCGSSVGTIFMPPAYNAVELYGWRYVLILNGALMLGCTFLGFFFLPLKPTLVMVPVRPEPKQVQFREPAVKKDKKGKKTKSKPLPPKRVEPGKAASFVTLKGVGVAPSSTSVYMSMQESRPPENPPTEEEIENSNARPMYRDDIFYPASAARLGSQVNHSTQQNSSRVTIRFRNSPTNERLYDSGARPLYREDIFYPANVIQRESQTMYHSSTFSLVRLPTVQDLRAKEQAPCKCCTCCTCCKCPCCSPGVRRALASLLDTNLLKSPVFIGIIVSQAICILGYHAPLLFTYVRAQKSGMTEDHASWLMPLMGIANTIGRLLCGAIVEIPHFNALHLTSITFAIGGIFTIISCVDHGYRLQFAYVVVFGLMAAAFMAMKSIILVDYLGIERLTNAFGLMLMFQGFAALCGPPLAGFIVDMTGNYDSAFYCAGTIAIVGGLSGFLVIPLKNYEVKIGLREH